MAADITVVVPSIPPRQKLLRKAVWSVLTQTLPATALVIEVDHHRTGAAATKNRGISKVTTEWVAMLDDDDSLMPDHLRLLHRAAVEHDADVVYSIPHVDGGAVYGRFGQPFDAQALRQYSYIPTTSLFRTKLLQQVGGFQCPPGSQYDDWGAYLALLDAGATFWHEPVVTWVWQHWEGNTSGQPSRW